MSYVVVLGFMAPVFAAVLSIVILGEVPAPAMWIGAL